MAQVDFQPSFHLNTIEEHALPAHVGYVPSMSVDGGDMGMASNAIMTSHLTDAISWPWLHENLYLPPAPDTFMNGYGALEIPDFDNDVLFAPVEGSFVFTGSALASAMTSAPANLPAQPLHQETSASEVVEVNDRSFSPAGLSASSDAAMADGSRTGDCSIATNVHPGIPNLADVPHPSNRVVQQPVTPRSCQAQVVDELVVFATESDSHLDRKAKCAAFWQLTSPKIAAAFEIAVGEESSAPATLYRFFDLYCANFGPLWPLLSPQTLEADLLHPILFLVLTSIGSMYGGPAASNYGAMMHARVRTSLCGMLGSDSSESECLSLAQARLLTQVAALYFGQSQAFTYAQRLGAILVAQARRLDLFSAVPAAKIIAKFHRLKGSASDHERLSIWLRQEARRRLAFGIFRADTYTSVLLHTRPLISLEEIDLEFPMCDTVWHGERMVPSLCLQLIEHEQNPGRQMRASDVYRVAMDKEEALPPLDPCAQELLMFGLQYPVWRFSHDQDMFARLTGDESPELEIEDLPMNHDSSASIPSPERCRTGSRAHASTLGLEIHTIDVASRTMAYLKLERSRLISALQKWERALPLVKAFAKTDRDRSSLLSSLILYHLAYLRLQAPLEDLHQVQYLQADNRPVDQDLVTQIYDWANSPRGRVAAARACIFWSLIAREAQLDGNKRVRFNLLAFTALHHGAVLLWAYAGAHDFADGSETGQAPLALESNSKHSAIRVEKSQSAKMMRSFVELYDCISHARWSSFAQAAEKLSVQQFPLKQSS
ncbi:hypothetical protein LTR47_011343 [Exophiala xenobiotica]|nr:hypothetical protein LTR72_011316 [Exophiala xenobiotica]KAK5220227.1 hypothetical protein LTR47_011343 [Exophiala xenobiotica]KAK5244443.1 hypothetical protein LTS06_009990 [Exophiala xenobiotica]KAK5282548.1 hypothetical protein LTR40_003129 [Exophiala xenobiotica]KAK5285023.1 hypothetical protein LTR14_011295 [Exophiala xenobiotica]